MQVTTRAGMMTICRQARGVDWLSLFRQLHVSGFQGSIIVEIAGKGEATIYWIVPRGRTDFSETVPGIR